MPRQAGTDSGSLVNLKRCCQDRDRLSLPVGLAGEASVQYSTCPIGSTACQCAASGVSATVSAPGRARHGSGLWTAAAGRSPSGPKCCRLRPLTPGQARDFSGSRPHWRGTGPDHHRRRPEPRSPVLSIMPVILGPGLTLSRAASGRHNRDCTQCATADSLPRRRPVTRDHDSYSAGPGPAPPMLALRRPLRLPVTA